MKMTQTRPLPQTGNVGIVDPNSVSAATAPVMNAEQKKLRYLIERRHPEYQENLGHWDFLEDTYEGGRDWFNDGNIFRYIKEGEGEYADRIKRCYRFNHTREVVDLVNKYLFKQNITRNEVDAPDSVKRFWESSTRYGLEIRDFMRQASKKASTLGRIGIVVDNTAASGSAISRADERKLGVKTYAYIVGPKQLLDYSKDDNGELNWILVLESKRDDEDPLSSSGEVRPRYRLWTKTEWSLLEEQKTKGGKSVVVIVDHGEHNLGEVPVILHDNIISDEEFTSPSLIDDIAYLDRACANYLSNLDAIIQDQTFSQLAMPAQNVLPGEDNYTKLVEMGTNRTFLYDGEGGAQPFYLSPDPKQAHVILAVISKIINEIYHTVGLAGERTKEDNAAGIDNSSGVAKAYDFERVNALLQAKADSLEVLENKLVRLVALWNGEEKQLDGLEELVEYPNNFDTRGLYDEFDIAGRLLLVNAPDAVRRQQMEALIDKLFPQLAKDLKSQMLKELQDWPINPVDLAAAMSEATAGANSKVVGKTSVQQGAGTQGGGPQGAPKAARDNKQGQNNKQAAATAPGNR